MNNFDEKKNIVGDRLVLKMQKTKEMIGLPMTEKLRELFERIDYQPLFLTNQYYNRALKDVANFVGIDVALTGHISRHTFAVMCAEAGISQEVTAKLLGHKDLKMTQIYYQITNRKIDNELTKLYK